MASEDYDYWLNIFGGSYYLVSEEKRKMSQEPRALCRGQGVALGRQDPIMAGKGAGEGLSKSCLTLPCLWDGEVWPGCMQWLSLGNEVCLSLLDWKVLKVKNSFASTGPCHAEED